MAGNFFEGGGFGQRQPFMPWEGGQRPYLPKQRPMPEGSQAPAFILWSEGLPNPLAAGNGNNGGKPEKQPTTEITRHFDAIESPKGSGKWILVESSAPDVID